jgi:uncharacterized protein YndB with AHSA1/START domain
MNAPTFTIDRTFNAPRATVWKVYSDYEHLKHWWGPAGFTWISGSLDFRPGGLFHYGMRSPNGDEMWGKFVYHEIEAPKRITFVNSFSDKDAGITRAPFSPNWPLEVMNVVTFTEKDGKTTLSMTGTPINATEAEMQMFDSWKPSMQQGFKGTLDQLEAYLATL